MEEKTLIKSERYDVKKVAIFTFLIGVLLLVIYAIFDACRYSSEFQSLSKKNYDWFTYKSSLEMAIHYDGGFIVAMLLPVLFAIIAIIVYICYSKMELTVTNKRVFGVAKFGKRVDLPLDSISAIGTTAMNGLAVTTASGAIKFKYIKNRDEIHKIISKLLVDRQNQEKSVGTTIMQEVQQSSADELKKYKDLLDQGIISQEEFAAKKKQLLGL